MAGGALWPREAVAFLRELEDHNDRDWFKANRGRWEEAIRAPTQALAEALADFGRPRTFRPYRDTRFHPGPPIKEQVGLAVGYEGAGGFYVELSLDGIFVATGLHNPQRDQVARLREGFDDGRRAGKLARALKQAAEAGLRLPEPELKRGPRGYPADHPRMELLRRRSLIASQRHPLGAWVHRPGAVDRVRTQFEAGRPLVRWIREHVGPPNAA
jgi:uncharacterized protein (TIGR02453 family)